jgi:hypothetical protein
VGFGILADMADKWHIDEIEHGEPLRPDGDVVSHVLVFDEGFAYDRQDLVVEAVKFLQTLPGVTEVEHIEREAVGIAAPAMPTSRLTEAMRDWWAAAKRHKPPWMAAVDRAADIVSNLVAAHGFQRQGWELTRVLDAELTHVIALGHESGGRPDRHWLAVGAYFRLTLPDVHGFLVLRYTGELDADAELAEAITGRMLPALDALPTVDAMLDRWQDRRSIDESGRRPYHFPDSWLHAQVLVARGRLAEAGSVYQRQFEDAQPRQRKSLLELVARQAVPPLTTATNPHLSVAQDAALAAWQADTASMADRLRTLTGLRLDGSARSVDDLWAWLRDSYERLQTTFADLTPALGSTYYGVLTENDIRSGRLPFEPWHRVCAELVTAYLGQVVMAKAPGTQWGIGGDGELAMVHLGGTALLRRVFTLIHEEFGSPTDGFHSRRLGQLVNDMVRWVNDGQYPPWIVRLGTPGP